MLMISLNHIITPQPPINLSGMPSYPHSHKDTHNLTLGLPAFPSLTSFSSLTLFGTFCLSKNVCWDSFPSHVCVYVWMHILWCPSLKDSSCLSEFIFTQERSKACLPFVLGTFLIKLIWDWWMNLVTCLSFFQFSFYRHYTSCVRGRGSLLSGVNVVYYRWFFFPPLVWNSQYCVLINMSSGMFCLQNICSQISLKLIHAV